MSTQNPTSLKVGMIQAHFWILAFLLVSCKSAPIEVPLELEDQLVLGRKLTSEGRFDDAEDILEDARSLSTDQKIIAQATFLLARNDFQREEYTDSLARYKKFVRDNPFSPLSPQVEEGIYQIALACLEGKATGFLGLPVSTSEAVGVLEYLRETFSRGHRSADVLRLLGQHYFDDRYYEEALLEYEALAEDHPESEWRPVAEFRIALCFLLQCRGPEYDLETLRRARFAFGQYLANNPEGSQRDQANSAIEVVNRMVEERAFKIGPFYELRNEFRGALLSYQEAVAAYPQSDQSERAKARIQALTPVVQLIEAEERANDPIASRAQEKGRK